MFYRFITSSLLTACLLLAEKPSPFPDKHAKESGSSDRTIETSSSPMAGTASFFRLKDNAPASDLLTAAHISLPVGSRVKVRNETNGKTVVVRITDRLSNGSGPIISVSRPAAEQLGFVRDGTARVKLELVADSATR